MTLDLITPSIAGAEASVEPWRDPAAYWTALTHATTHLPAPVAAVSLPALRYNALDMVVRAGGKPIRVASKSVRAREIVDATLAVPGYAGILAFTLAEALWLAADHDDVVLGYPTADRTALAALAADEAAAQRVTLMIDDPAQLDLVDAVAAPGARPVIRVAIDADASRRTPRPTPSKRTELTPRFTLFQRVILPVSPTGLGRSLCDSLA